MSAPQLSDGFWFKSHEVAEHIGERVGAIRTPGMSIGRRIDAIYDALETVPILYRAIHHAPCSDDVVGKHGRRYTITSATFHREHRFDRPDKDRIIADYVVGRDSPKGGFVRAIAERAVEVPRLFAPGSEAHRLINRKHRHLHRDWFLAVRTLRHPFAEAAGTPLGFMVLHLDPVMLARIGFRTKQDIDRERGRALVQSLEAVFDQYAYEYALAATLNDIGSARSLDPDVRAEHQMMFIASHTSPALRNRILKMHLGGLDGLLECVTPRIEDHDSPAFRRLPEDVQIVYRARLDLFWRLHTAMSEGCFKQKLLGRAYRREGVRTVQRWARDLRVIYGDEPKLDAKNWLARLGITAQPADETNTLEQKDTARGAV